MLIFFSGADRVPPLVFDQEPHVTFLHDQSAKFCTSSTCDLQLRLPCTHMEDYGAFKDAMVMSLCIAMMDLEVSDHFFYIKRIPSTTKSCVALQCVDHEFIIINPIVINNYNYYSKQDYNYHYYHHYHHGIIIANNNNHYYHCNTSKYKIIIL